VPARYEAIRDSYEAAGKPVSLAKKLAAMTFNATRKKGEAPVTGRAEGGLEKKLKKLKRMK